MPRRDGTGPMGMGPLTGRGLELCENSFNYVSSFRPECRRGIGRGFGMGLMRCFSASQINSKTKKELFEEQKEFLNNQLGDIDEELKNL